ncbi:MAG TPA: 2-oxo acid dehydrogenase subunit E2, partial [Streptosporangiaceae bacterium]
MNASDFGANQWLVDELYQRYLADPGSVDQAWWSFFSDYRSGGGNGDDAPEAASNGGATAAPPVANGTGGANGTSGSASAPAPVETGHANGTAAAPAPAPPAAPRPAAPSAPSAAPSAAAPAPAAPAPAPAKPAAPPAGGERNRLRGAAARTAVNMASSLAVPTATSVRDIPAKLLIDNRIVINNHLKRGRGGKVSFTHLIGWAVIRALAAIPAMNDSFAEDDGKPVLVQPEHVNLGLAIDVAKDDGSRQLLVPN